MFHLREFVQTHVILTILRVCWGGSVLQLLTPDPVNPVNPLNPVMNSKLCENHMAVCPFALGRDAWSRGSSLQVSFADLLWRTFLLTLFVGM